MNLKYFLITLFIVLGVTVLGVKNSWSDNDDDDDRHHGRRGSAQIAPPIYKTECGGSCHMVYPASLLPADSWRKMMSGLADHFGDNAELDPAVQAEITQYLVDNSGRSRRSRSRMQSPLRITQMPYFVHEHDEMSDRMIKNNPKVNSLSNCDACHERAELGFFDEHEVRIPGFGRWDD